MYEAFLQKLVTNGSVVPMIDKVKQDAIAKKAK